MFYIASKSRCVCTWIIEGSWLWLSIAMLCVYSRGDNDELAAGMFSVCGVPRARGKKRKNDGRLSGWSEGIGDLLCFHQIKIDITSLPRRQDCGVSRRLRHR